MAQFAGQREIGVNFPMRPVFATKNGGRQLLFAHFRKVGETSEIAFHRHVSMKLRPLGSGERGKRPEIALFAAVFFANTGV